MKLKTKIIVASSILCILAFAYNTYFRMAMLEYENIGSDIPNQIYLKIYRNNNDERIKNLEFNNIEWMLSNANTIKQNGKSIYFEFPFEIRDVDSNFILISITNATIMAGYKFIFLPNYTEFFLINIHDLSVVQSFIVRGYISEAALGKEFIYLQPEFRVDKFGRIKIQKNIL